MWWVFTVDCCVNLMRSPGWDAAVVQQQQRGWARLESPHPRPSSTTQQHSNPVLVKCYYVMLMSYGEHADDDLEIDLLHQHVPKTSRVACMLLVG